MERLRAENAELQDGQILNRWPLHKMLSAERALADQLAEALRGVLHDRPSAHTDNVWAVINYALNTYKEARREQ